MIRRNKLVKWQDHASENTWMDPEDIKEWADELLREFYNETKGDIVLETDEYLVVASENDGQGTYGNRTIIFKHPRIKINNIKSL